MKRITTLFSLILLSILTACTVTVTTPNPTTINITVETAELVAGASQTFTVEVTNATIEDVSWTATAGVLSPNTGASVLYTAPTVATDATITATVNGISDTVSVKVNDNPLVNSADAPANNDRNTAIASPTLQPGESISYKVIVSEQVASAGAALFVETTAVVDMTLFNASFAAVLSSASSDFFASGLSGLTSSAIQTQTITDSRLCTGSCLALSSTGAGTYYVSLKNTGSAAAALDLYAYVANLGDSNEANNNAVNDETFALAFDGNQSVADVGAIELVGDQDYYRIEGSGLLSLTSNSVLSVKAEIFDSESLLRGTISAGDSAFNVDSGYYIKVFSEGNTKAAFNSQGKYVVTLTSPQ